MRETAISHNLFRRKFSSGYHYKTKIRKNRLNGNTTINWNPKARRTHNLHRMTQNSGNMTPFLTFPHNGSVGRRWLLFSIFVLKTQKRSLPPSMIIMTGYLQGLCNMHLAAFNILFITKSTRLGVLRIRIVYCKSEL